MKILIISSVLLAASVALARPTAPQFNEALRESLKEDVRNDREIYRAPSRGPASVGPSMHEKLRHQKKATDKIEKQHKQLGTQEW